MRFCLTVTGSPRQIARNGEALVHRSESARSSRRFSTRVYPIIGIWEDRDERRVAKRNRARCKAACRGRRAELHVMPCTTLP